MKKTHIFLDEQMSPIDFQEYHRIGTVPPILGHLLKTNTSSISLILSVYMVEIARYSHILVAFIVLNKVVCRTLSTDQYSTQNITFCANFYTICWFFLILTLLHNRSLSECTDKGFCHAICDILIYLDAFNSLWLSR